MGLDRRDAGSGRRQQSAWRRGLLAALLPLSLLAWQVDPALISPGNPAAAPPAPAAPAAAVAEAAPMPLAPPEIPPPPPALAPRTPARVPRVSLELSSSARQHRRDFVAKAIATAAAEEAVVEEVADASPVVTPPSALEEGVYPLGLPDNPFADLRPRYFIDGPGGGVGISGSGTLPPPPVPEPGTGLLVALGLVVSGAAVRPRSAAGSPLRGRPRPARR